MNLREVRNLMRNLFMGALGAMMIGSFLQISLIVYVMLALFAGYAIVFAFMWRCPNCKKHLGKITVHQCKHCGHTID